tara:strand:+ start:2037 stop:2429 length:393 start_codon:yes stop_codon:yes gene_type:complete
MDIRDKNNKLLAMIFTPNDYKDEKHFLTEDNNEFQIAQFNLDQGTEIKRHIHGKQERKIENTSEVILVNEGSLELEIYDEDLKLVTTEIVNKGQVIALFNGGHGFKSLSNSKFLEVKQGPYIEEQDKERF